MIICVAIVGLICLYQIQFAFSKKNKAALPDGIYNDYLSIEKTNSIKGIFVLLIVFSHAASYLTLDDNILNKLYGFLNYSLIGQGIVAVFLFYSGYAMMLSGIKKGRAYIKSIPTKRILKVLLHFDIAIIIFAVIQTLLGKDITLKTFLLSLIGWSSVGNSNWYIFAILVFYLITYLAFIIGKDNEKIVLSIVCILTVAYILLMRMAKEEYWYDTSLLYPLGMFWYVFKDKLEQLFKNKKLLFYAAFVLTAMLYAGSMLLSDYLVFKLIKNAALGLLIILFTMKVQVHNKILCFFGKHLFSIYILQRIPMNVLSHFGLNSNPAVFVCLSFAITILIAVPFDMFLNKLDNLIFNREKLKINS